MITLEKIVEHILKIKAVDIEYARYAVGYYDELLPWMGIKAAVKEALE